MTYLKLGEQIMVRNGYQPLASGVHIQVGSRPYWCPMGGLWRPDPFCRGSSKQLTGTMASNHIEPHRACSGMRENMGEPCFRPWEYWIADSCITVSPHCPPHGPIVKSCKVKPWPWVPIRPVLQFKKSWGLHKNELSLADFGTAVSVKFVEHRTVTFAGGSHH